MELKEDFSDGDVLYSKTTSDPDGLNGITNEVNRKGVIHRKVYSSAAEYTQASASATYIDTDKTFTLTAPINSLIIGINILHSTKSNESNQHAYTILKISGTNLGTMYISGTNSRDVESITSNTSNNSVAIVTSNTDQWLSRKYNDSYRVFSTHFNKPIKILDTNTTFLFQIHSGVTGSTRALIKDVVVEVIYVENFEEDA